MKITAVHLYTMRIPLLTPFKTALRTVENMENVVVTLETDEGATGFGEAPPTAVITGDTIPSIAGAIRDFLAPKILGREVTNADEMHDLIDGAMVHNTSAKAAVEMAVYDLIGKKWGIPLYKLLGGARSSLETDITISVNDVETMVRDAVAACERGFRILKVKVGTDVELDLVRLTAIRSSVPVGTVLRVDANQGWTPRQAVRIIGRLEDAGLNAELVEQPVKAQDVDGLRYVTAHVHTPILADESVFSAADAVRILDTHAADLINIKLMKTGGLYNAMTIASIAKTFGAECMMGCMLEGNIAVTAAVHAALARGVITRIDLDGPALCRENPVVGGAMFENSRITVPDAPGLGIERVEGLIPLNI
ncbi:MAG: mandelate racemase/muconate lactonizing enzyme family protein [Candidatus Spyradocola sp.]|jgi:o-succinylbenzoate synthase